MTRLETAVFDDHLTRPSTVPPASSLSLVGGSFSTRPQLFEASPQPRARLVVENVPTRLLPTIKRIAEIGQLEQNWDSYGARAIDPIAVVSAIRWLLGAMSENTPLPQVVPTVGGGLQVEWHEADNDIEVRFSADGRVEAWLEDHRTAVQMECDVTLDASPIVERLSQISARR